MNDTLKSCLCACLDILGFSEVIERAYSQGKETQLLEEISIALTAATERLKSFCKQSPEFSVKLFTDNIVIGWEYFTNDAHVELQVLCDVLADYQLKMVSKGYFVRGAISIGTLMMDDNLVFGDALLKAHRLEATQACNPRIIVDPKLEKVAVQSGSSSVSTGENFFKFHLMSDVDGYLFVNYLWAIYEWRYDAQHGHVLWPNEEKLQNHGKQIVQSLTATRTDPRKWAKYFWVANYHNSYCERLGMKQHMINESLLRTQPVSL